MRIRSSNLIHKLRASVILMTSLLGSVSVATATHHVAILDPVDLGIQEVSPDWGRALRSAFAGQPAWSPLPVEKMDAKLKEYSINPATPCHEFQCAFDAGNVLLTEFIVFSTSTQVGAWQTFTLNLVHVPSSQVVLSRAGEVRRAPESKDGKGGETLEKALEKLLADIEPASLKTGKRAKKGLITVLELGPGLAASRVLADRLSTRLHSLRQFDILTQNEQKDLLAALEIDKSKYSPSDSGMYGLGGKMGVSHLLASRLHQEDAGYRMSLALYDVGARRKLREWPSRSEKDFRKLLLTEEKFFSGLFGDIAAEPLAGKSAGGGGKGWVRAGAGLSLALSLGTAAGAVWAYQDSDRQYARYQAALSSTSAALYQSRVQRRERETTALTGASVLFLALSAVSLNYSF